jgi:sugar transferase EpsL
MLINVALNLKRGMDVVGASAALVLLSPLLAWIAIAILVTMGRPIFFRQERPGLHGRPFTILKFRSMRAARPDEVWYLTGYARVTRLGAFLRSTSLDELPELFNVLRGEMSLVGPRPLFSHYLDHYTDHEHRRHEMRPGMTGWAVVNGRNSLQFKERVRLDVWYVDHWSLGLDVRILLRTIAQVIHRTNVAIVEDDVALGFPMAGQVVDHTGSNLGTRPAPGSTNAVETGDRPSSSPRADSPRAEMSDRASR